MAEEECFPQGLKLLTDQLASAVVPGLTELPGLTDVKQFGPCFNAAAIRSQGTGLTQSGSWAAVRLKVLSLVATCPTLTHVNLSNCCIDDESEMRILGLGLEKSQTLESLNLSGNMAVGSKAGCGYVNRILSGCKKLHTLSLAGVGMGWEGMAKVAGAMAHDIALRHLDISANPKLGDNGMALLSASLKGQLSFKPAGGEDRFRGLTSLTVGCMTVAGATHLAQALAAQTSHGSMEVLKIFGPVDEEEVVQEEGSPLTVLLSSLIHPGPPTEYDDMAAPAVYNETLKYLSLKFVKEDGLAGTLGEILRSNNTLLSLHLEGSEFSRVGWREIIRALHDNTTLTSLFLGSCQGLGDMFEDFMDLARVNSTLEFIELPNTELERSGQNVLIMDALNKGSRLNHAEDAILESIQKLKVAGVPSRHETWGENVTADKLARSGSQSGNDDSETINVDLDSLPKGLVDLVMQLTSDSPTITVLPRLSTMNVQEFGDFFTFPHFTRENQDETWWQTRRAVLYIIASCPTLTHIDLEGCGIHKEEEVQELCGGLANSQRLEMLNLGGNGGFGTEVGCVNLCRLLVKLTTLRELHLHAIDMKPDFLVYLTAALRTSPDSRLQTLDINFNSGLEDEGAENLAKLLADEVNPCRIRHLRMFGTGMGIKGAFLMAIALRVNTSLKSLFVGFETEDENAEGPLSMLLSAFISVVAIDDGSTQLPCNTTVENLGVCGGRETGLAAVLAKILQVSKIRALTLNCTYFTQAEWQEIFKSLHYNQSLEALDMTKCEGLYTTAHQEIMTMLQFNKRLSDITLAQTELERSGGQLSIKQKLLERTGSSSSGSGSQYGTPASSGDWSQHGAGSQHGVGSHHGVGSDIPPGTPYTPPPYIYGNSGHYTAPVTASPYYPVSGQAHPAQETPSWVPASSASGPPAYFPSGPPGQPSNIPGPPAYFSSSSSHGPPRPQASVSNSHPPGYPVPPPPPHPGFPNPGDAHPGAYQAHGGGYMMTPEPVSGHHIYHHNPQQSSHHSSPHFSHQPSHQNSGHHSYHNPPHPNQSNNEYHSFHNSPHSNQSSNEWSPTGEPVWSAAQQAGGAPVEADAFFNGPGEKKGSRFGRLKEKVKDKKGMVVEVAKQGKELVSVLAKDKKEKVLVKFGRKPSTKI